MSSVSWQHEAANCQIKTVDDVRSFLGLIRTQLAFCPDAPAKDYVAPGEHGASTFSAEECVKFDEVVRACFAVCMSAGIDFHTLSQELCEEFPIVFLNPCEGALGPTIEYAPYYTDHQEWPSAMRYIDDSPHSEPEYWSVFVRGRDGLAVCVGNYKDRASCETLLRLLFGEIV